MPRLGFAGQPSMADLLEGDEVERAADDIVADFVDRQVVVPGVAMDTSEGLVDGYVCETGDDALGLFQDDLVGRRDRKVTGVHGFRFTPQDCDRGGLG
jgi:hypothetical protein